MAEFWSSKVFQGKKRECAPHNLWAFSNFNLGKFYQIGQSCYVLNFFGSPLGGMYATFVLNWRLEHAPEVTAQVYDSKSHFQLRWR